MGSPSLNGRGDAGSRAQEATGRSTGRWPIAFRTACQRVSCFSWLIQVEEGGRSSVPTLQQAEKIQELQTQNLTSAPRIKSSVIGLEWRHHAFDKKCRRKMLSGKKQPVGSMACNEVLCPLYRKLCPTSLRKMRERSFHIFPSITVFHFVTNQTKVNKNWKQYFFYEMDKYFKE